MSTEHTTFMRIKKLKGSGIIAIAARHNLREIQSEFGVDSHIDTTKIADNIVLRGANTAAGVAAEAVSLMTLANPKRPLQKNGVHGLEIIFSLPNQSDIPELDYFKSCVLWAEVFFEIPIISAVSHRDESAPHCHLILLPLFDGRMIGSGLVGNKARLTAMQADFYSQVGAVYGLQRGKAARRYTASVRAAAADAIINHLRRSPDALNEPTMRDVLRDALTEVMNADLMEMFKVNLPVNTKSCKPANPIGFQKPEKPIGFHAEKVAKNIQTLSCVGFQSYPQVPQPKNTPIPAEPELNKVSAKIIQFQARRFA